MSTDFTETHFGELHLYDGLQESPDTGENFLIPGPTGVLEALTHIPPAYTEGSPIAVICHPHPLHGGSMSNKVVHIIAESFHDMGVATLRFNFRGVGHSQGSFDSGNGEQQDLAAAAAWLRQRHQTGAPLWLAGFSFGSYVAFRAHEVLQSQRLLLVAPPVGRFDFSEPKQVRIPWLVIQGGKDDVVSPQQVSAWVHRHPMSPQYEWFADADHFFHGRLNRIRNAIKTAWSDALVT
jgi:alpha/beta superfamily hydrolase